MGEMRIPRVGVGAVILNPQGEILLVLRNRPPESGHWSIPGGKVEWMETLEDTIVREVAEEVGLEVRMERLLCVTNHLVPADQAHWVAPTYQCAVVGGQAVNREPGAIRDLGWFPLDRLPGPLTLTTRAALEALARAAPTPSPE